MRLFTNSVNRAKQPRSLFGPRALSPRSTAAWHLPTPDCGSAGRAAGPQDKVAVVPRLQSAAVGLAAALALGARPSCAEARLSPLVTPDPLLISVGSITDRAELTEMVDLRQWDFGGEDLLGCPLSCGLLSDLDLAEGADRICYQPMGVALEALKSDDSIQVTLEDGAIVFSPRGFKSGSGVVFFGGYCIDPRAYSPFLKALSLSGHTVAIFESRLSTTRASYAFISQNTDVGRWFFGGHSLGGIVAAERARFSPKKVEGVFLFAAYPVYKSNTRYLDVRAENDEVQSLIPFRLLRSLYAPLTRFYLPQKNITRVFIRGGNHANFGYYGPQKHDGDATISREQQQELIISKVLEFMMQPR